MRTMRRFAAVGLFIALLVIERPGPIVAGAAAGTVVSGTVSGSDQGFLTDASVTLDGSQHRQARTDADGRFTFADVPRGRYQISIAADGYLPLDRPMDVADASISVDIVLLRIPVIP